MPARERYVPADAERRVTIAEAVPLLGRSRETIRQLCLDGTLPAARIGRGYSIGVGAIRAFLERSEAEVQATVAARAAESASQRRRPFPKPVPADAIRPIAPIRKRRKAAA